MIKIITEVFKRPDGSCGPYIYAVKEDGEIDRAITDTLCEFVSFLFSPVEEFLILLEMAKAGKYVRADPLLADFNGNDINVWVVPPFAKEGCICFANENIPEYSSDEEDGPQHFSFAQFDATFSVWLKFQEFIREKGIENLAGQKFETIIP